RNDIRGQWRFYRLAKQMTPKTVDWDLFLGHQFECAGVRVGPAPREQPFDRACFAQWRCLWPFSGGPFTDMLVHHVTRMTAAMGGFQLFKDDPTRGASYPPRLEQPLDPAAFESVEPPKNETEALWENFLECVRARRQSTFSPPDLGAVAVATAAMAVQSYRTGQALYWDREKRAIAPADSSWAERWAKRSAMRAKPNQVF